MNKQAHLIHGEVMSTYADHGVGAESQGADLVASLVRGEEVGKRAQFETVRIERDDVVRLILVVLPDDGAMHSAS